MKWILVYVWLTSYGWFSMKQIDMTYESCQKLKQTVTNYIQTTKSVGVTFCVRDDSGDKL
jgi:hypothetical protein